MINLASRWYTFQLKYWYTFQLKSTFSSLLATAIKASFFDLPFVVIRW
jgi:hypothetical protein